MRARASYGLSRVVCSTPRLHHDEGFELDVHCDKQPAATGLQLLERTSPCAAALSLGLSISRSHLRSLIPCSPN